jgi:hypothetical protein
MQDLVNFVCVKIIYGERFDLDPAIGALLRRVGEGRMSFSEAVAEMP